MAATKILITGANQGIGHQVIQQLLVQGRFLLIYSACRTWEKAKANVEKLIKTPCAHSSNRIEPIVVDLSDDKTIQEAASSIPDLDILVNNAGIYVEEDFSSPAAIRKALLETYDINVFGTIAMSTAFLPKLQKSAKGGEKKSQSSSALINVSTGLSSFTNMTTPTSPQYHSNEIMYSSSKTALNAYTVWAAKKNPDVRVVAIAPGHTATALNNFKGRQTVDVGAQWVTNVILDFHGPSGVFIEKDKVHSW